MMNKMKQMTNMMTVTVGLCAVLWLLMGNVGLAQGETGLLHIYALALDNNPNTGASLETQHTIIISNFIQATENNPNTTIVAMIDLHNGMEVDDSDHIVVVQNGNVTEIRQLPTKDGTLIPSAGQYEYDMVSAEQLGGFIKWARMTYSGQKSIFSYVGHGTFNPSFTATPVFVTDVLSDVGDVDFGNTFVPMPTDHPAAVPGAHTPTATPLPPRPPLPWLIEMGYARTDAVTTDGSPQLLTPQLLAKALAIGTDDGANRFDVIDLVHCFSGSAEQYYEVAQYADVIIGSPNYGYIASDAFGKIIETVDVTMNITTMAETIIAGYTETLEQANADWEAFGYEHPYAFSAVSSSQMETVKTEVDGLAGAIMAEFEVDPEETMTRLDVVQKTNGIFYDTSLCTDPFVLSEADALVDIGTLSAALQDVFVAQADVLAAAGRVDAAVDSAVIAYQAKDGVPWFAGEGAQMWALEHEAAVGMSMFAGLGAEVGEDDVITRPWQYNRYTSNVPTPYVDWVLEGERLKWITSEWPPSSDEVQYNWANVVERYWAEKMMRPTPVQTVDLDDETSGCLPQLEIVQELGELTAESVIVNQHSGVYAGEPITFGGIINNEERLLTALTMFRAVALDGTELFSTTVSSTNLHGGRHWIEADETWVAPAMPFTLEMMVDANDHVIEDDETDNVAAVSLDAPPQSAGSVVATLDEPQTVSTDTEISLQYVWDGDESTIDTISCLFYRLVPQDTPLSVVPIYAGISFVEPVGSGEPFSCRLSSAGNVPGTYQVVVALVDATGEAISAAEPVWVNYIPEQVALPSGEAHTFVFPAEEGDAFDADFASSARWVSAFLWKPNVIYPTNDVSGVGTMDDVADTAGRFTVSINNPCPTSELYTLDLSQGGVTPPDVLSLTCSVPLSVEMGTAGQSAQPQYRWGLVVTGIMMVLGTVFYSHTIRFTYHDSAI